MGLIKKCFLAVTLLAVVALGFAGSASALPIYPDTGPEVPVVDYTGPPILSGMYYVTPLHSGTIHYPTANTVTLMDGQNNVIFTNWNIAAEFGTVKTVDMSTAYFFQTNPNHPTIGMTLVNSPGVGFGQLVENLTLSNGLSLSAGTLILSMNFVSPERLADEVDYCVAAWQVTPTPIPAAVWLLGSGLAGLVGFKRRRPVRS